MTAYTPNYGIPYPQATDPINFYLDLQNVADQVDFAVTSVANDLSSMDAGIEERAVDAVGAAIASGTQTGISISYNDAANSLSFSVPTVQNASPSISGKVYGLTNSDNTGIGSGTLSGLTSGVNNVAIGKDSGLSITTGSNNIALGYDAQPTSASVSNQITLGNNSITSLRCNVTSITALSDARDKINVSNLDEGLNFINTLRPVRFTWSTRDGARYGDEDIGFLAQEVAAAEDLIGGHEWLNLTNRDNLDRLEMTPGRLIPILVKAVQELTEKVADLQSELEFRRMSSLV